MFLPLFFPLWAAATPSLYYVLSLDESKILLSHNCSHICPLCLHLLGKLQRAHACTYIFPLSSMTIFFFVKYCQTSDVHFFSLLPEGSSSSFTCTGSSSWTAIAFAASVPCCPCTCVPLPSPWAANTGLEIGVGVALPLIKHNPWLWAGLGLSLVVLVPDFLHPAAGIGERVLLFASWGGGGGSGPLGRRRHHA